MGGDGEWTQADLENCTPRVAHLSKFHDLEFLT
jgi:hypothetical protein